MKIFLKIAPLVILGALCISGCGGESSASKSGEAYSLVHGGKYVACVTLSAEGDKVTAISLNEVCFPDHVTAEDDTEDDTVTEDEETFYKYVSFGGTELTYEKGKGYMKEEKPLSELFKDKSLAEEYYKAVMDDKVYVTVGGQKKSGVMTKSALSKDENGYWTRTDKNGEKYSRWKMNRDATLNYVLNHGVGNLTSLKKSETASADKFEDKEVYYWMDGDISTGATWVDLNSSEAVGYESYAKLIITAFNNAE